MFSKCYFYKELLQTVQNFRFRTFIEFHSKLESGETKKMVDAEPDMYIIFNPWCEGNIKIKIA